MWTGLWEIVRFSSFLGFSGFPLRKVVYMIAKFIQLVKCNLSCFGGLNRLRRVSEPEPVGEVSQRHCFFFSLEETGLP